jgi:hypothetical protein
LIKLKREKIELLRRKPDRLIKMVPNVILPVISKLDDKFMNTGGVVIGKNALAGIMSLVANASILFTTRDWDVTGTMSSMTASLIAFQTNQD